MQRDDIACLRHILDAADKAVSFAKGKERRDLKTDEMLSLSLVRLLEIIGEAAPNYNLDILWDTILEDLPPLVKDLKEILSEEAGSRYAKEPG